MEVEQQDFWPLVRIQAAQQAYWETQREYVASRSDFYKHLWGPLRPPRNLAELPILPLTSKKMFRDSQERSPPFGDYLAAPVDRINRIHRTSGTTGRPITMALSQRDALLNAEVGGRSLRACGIGRGQMAVHCLNFQMWMGGLSDHLVLEATGAASIPFGVGATELLIRTILDLRITAIQCTPSNSLGPKIPQPPLRLLPTRKPRSRTRTCASSPAGRHCSI